MVSHYLCLFVSNLLHLPPFRRMKASDVALYLHKELS